MYTSTVVIPEEKVAVPCGSVLWPVFGTAPMVLTGPFKQIWSASFGDGALGLTQTTWTDWSAVFGVRALGFVGLFGPKHGRLVGYWDEAVGLLAQGPRRDTISTARKAKRAD